MNRQQPLRVAVVTADADALGALVAQQGCRRDGLQVVGFAPESTDGTEGTDGTDGTADAFVLVTPADEVPAGLRQTIEAVPAVWRGKPVAFVSDGPVGATAEWLRGVFAELHVVTVGAFDPSAIAVMFEQLEWWGRALRPR